MTRHQLLRGSLGLFAAVGVLWAVVPVGAQPSGDKAGKPKEVPHVIEQKSSVPNRADIPNAEVAKQLRGIAPPPIATPEDKLPLPLMKLPRGFRAEVYVSGIANARTIRLTERGTLFVSNRQLDKVWAVVDRNGKREAKVIASGLDRPNGLAFHNGTLYIAEGTRITKLENIEDNLDKPPQPVVVYSDLPNTQSHGWRYIGIGPDGKLYINVGAPCNICEPMFGTAQIRRLNLDGSGAEPYALGVRNSVGFDWHPGTEATLLHRQRPRLAVRGSAGGRAQPGDSRRPAFRLPLLPPGRLHRP